MDPELERTLEEQLEEALQILVSSGRLEAAQAFQWALQTRQARKAAGLTRRDRGKSRKSQFPLNHPLVLQSVLSQAGLSHPICAADLDDFGFADSQDRAANKSVREINQSASGLAALLKLTKD